MHVTVHVLVTRHVHAHPYIQNLTLQSPQSHAVGVFIPSSWRPGMSMESPLNTRGLHLKKIKCSFSRKPFSTHKCSQAPPPTTGGCLLPQMQTYPQCNPSAVIWANLCFGLEMPYLILWLVLWRDWNPFLGQCRILELFRLEKTSKIIESKC